MRHGKANQFSSDGNDFGRALAEKGIKQSQNAAIQLASLGLAPGVVASSSATRARQTAEELAQNLQPVPRLEFFNTLYGQRVESYISCLMSYDTEETVMVAGHAPVINDLIEFFTGDSILLKTGGLAVLQLPDSGGKGLFSAQRQAEMVFSLRVG